MRLPSARCENNTRSIERFLPPGERPVSEYDDRLPAGYVLSETDLAFPDDFWATLNERIARTPDWDVGADDDSARFAWLPRAIEETGPKANATFAPAPGQPGTLLNQLSHAKPKAGPPIDVAQLIPALRSAITEIILDVLAEELPAALDYLLAERVNHGAAA